MKRTWQVWSTFLLCLLAVAIAMLWLSLKTFELDALQATVQVETELARREAELQERISSTLYRLDLKMLPLIAQEAWRPQLFYESISPLTTQHIPVEFAQISSPLHEMSDAVLLYFEVSSMNVMTTPQLPDAAQNVATSELDSVAAQNFRAIRTKFEQAQTLFDYQTLVQQTEANVSALLANSASSSPAGNTTEAYRVPAVDNFLQQIHLSNTNHLSTEDQTSQKGELDALADDLLSRKHRQRQEADQRINSSLTQRRNSTQEVTQLNALYGNASYPFQSTGPSGKILPSTTESTKLPPMQPIWLGKNLILARHVTDENQSRIQCCWLNWAKIRRTLQDEAAELLPDLQFEAVTADTELKIGTALTTIPVQLMVDRPKMLAMLAKESVELPAKSTLPISLLAAWICLVLAAVATGLLLQGVIRLSERRAAFVSAVTHELRTPLTTFRMYSEMLADGMVAAEKQQQYANTLKVQADRLAHLVENVLQFARLERGSSTIVNDVLTVSELLNRFRPRLEERAHDSKMTLVFEVADSTAGLTLITQPAAIEQILFNLVDNACKYAQAACDRRIVIAVTTLSKGLRISVQDFGPGIKPSDRRRMYLPFQQSASASASAVPGVGLGLALCDRMARALGGQIVDQPCQHGAMFILDLPASSVSPTTLQPIDLGCD